jgi:hypothetical protein
MVSVIHVEYPSVRIASADNFSTDTREVLTVYALAPAIDNANKKIGEYLRIINIFKRERGERTHHCAIIPPITLIKFYLYLFYIPNIV